MKIWQAFLIILLCVGTTLVSYAQNTFSKAYDINYGSELGAAAYKVVDGYILFGTGPASQTDPTFITKILKVDFNGNLLWAKSYGGLGITRTINYGAGGVTSDGNGSYYIAGAYADTSSESEDVLVTKVSSEGDTLWSKMFGGKKQDLPNSIYYDSNRSLIYITGGTRSFAPGNLKVFVWILDTLGNTVNTWLYGGGVYDYGKSVIAMEDTIYLSGYTTSYSNSSDPFLMKLDTSGAVVDIQLYGTNGFDKEAGIDRNLRGDKLVMWGRLDTLQDAVFVTTLDSNGIVVWRKLIDWYGYIFQARVAQDNSIFIAGINKFNRVNGNVAKLDSLGNVLWYREYSFNDNTISGLYSTCYFYDIKLDTLNGDILCFGNTQRDPALGDSTEQDFWLLKLDSMGCLVPGCDTITEVGIQPIETSGPQITVYPNPAKYTARVLLNHGTPNAEIDFTLFGLSGQAIITQKHSLNPYGFGEWTINLEGLSPGIYVYRIGSGGKAVNGKLLVE